MSSKRKKEHRDYLCNPVLINVECTCRPIPSDNECDPSVHTAGKSLFISPCQEYFLQVKISQLHNLQEIVYLKPKSLINFVEVS